MNTSWTEEEKLLLLELLEKYGVGDVSLITSGIPTKTEAEVKYALSLYERAGITQQNIMEESQNTFPIEKWISILKDISNNRDVSQDIVTAMRLIAIYDEHTTESSESDVNIKECYEFLADVLSGKPTKKLKTSNEIFLLTCIIKLANIIEEEDITKELNFLEKLNRTNILSKSYVPKNASVLMDPLLNLLKVPKDLLKNNRAI